MLSKQNQAILLMAKTKPFNDKVKQIGNGYQKLNKPTPQDEAQAQAEWVRFKSECVLLKGRRSK